MVKVVSAIEPELLGSSMASLYFRYATFAGKYVCYTAYFLANGSCPLDYSACTDQDFVFLAISDEV